MADVSERRIQLPTQTVVEGQVWTDLPTVLPKQGKQSAADIFSLRRTLQVEIWKTEQIVRVKIVGEDDVVISSAKIIVLSIDVEK